MKSIFKRRLLYRYFTSYILLFVVITVINLYAYLKYQDLIEKQVNDISHSNMKTIMETIDFKISEIDSLINIINMNERNTALMYLEEDYAAQRIAEVKMISDLAMYDTVNQFVKNFIIYYQKSDMILTKKGKYEPDKYYDIYDIKKQMPYGSWIQYLNSKHSKEFLYFKDENGLVTQTYLVQKLPIHSLDRRGALLLIEFDMDYLASYIHEATGDAFIGVIDKNNNVLFSNETKFIGEIKSNESNQLDYQGKCYHIIRQKQKDLVYIYAQDEKIYNKSLNTYKSILIKTFVVLAIIGIAFSLIISFMNYRPTKHVIDILGHPEQMEKMNEYQLIESAIYDLINRDNDLQTRLDNQTAAINYFALKNLLLGNQLKNLDLRNIIKRLGINENVYIVVSYDFNDNFLKKHIIKIQDMVYNSFDQTFVRHFIHFGNELVWMIISESMSYEELKKACYHIFEGVNAKLISDNIEGVFGLSNVYKKADNIHQAYLESKITLEYRILKGTDKNITYDTIRWLENNHINKTYNIYDHYRKVVNAMREEDYVYAKDLITDLFDSLLAQEFKTSGQIENRISSIKEMILEALPKQDGEQLMLALNDANSLYQLRRVIVDRLTLFVENKSDEKMSKQKKMIAEIKRIIKKDFDKTETNVNSVCREIKVNPSYITRIFKEEVGIGIHEYLRAKRIEAAKQIMNKNKSVKIGRLYKSVGYASNITFIRAFKVHEGVTPGNYIKNKYK